MQLLLSASPVRNKFHRPWQRALLLQLLSAIAIASADCRGTICVELGLPLRLVWFDALLDKRIYSVIQLFCMVGEAE